MLLPFYNKEGILELLLKRIRQTLPEVKVIVATTTSQKDDALVQMLSAMNIPIFRGDEDDVLQRFIDTAEHYEAEKIIRVCADNPFLDLDALLQLADESESSQAEYIAWCTSNGTPTIKTHYGFWAEAVTRDALLKAAQLTKEKFYHEHVTNFLYGNPEQFNIELMPIDSTLESDDIRLTIDTKTDFYTAQQIYEQLTVKDIPFTAGEIIPFVRSNPVWLSDMQREIEKNRK